ncbi:MAG: DUF983 domain-containing protein [Alphaproteobacteria bacterium]|nr:DUF983 domain-containing protein [Alphaproteobacteria bacterium]
MNSLLRALANRCPRCGRAPLFKGWFTLYETCPSCSARHERMVGSWTIASWISASIGVTTGGLMAFFLYTKAGFSTGLELVIVGTAVVVTLLSYRPVKALTFGALHLIGMVHPDPVQVGNVIFMERYKARRDEVSATPKPERQAEGG